MEGLEEESDLSRRQGTAMSNEAAGYVAPPLACLLALSVGGNFAGRSQ